MQPLFQATQALLRSQLGFPRSCSASSLAIGVAAQWGTVFIAQQHERAAIAAVQQRDAIAMQSEVRSVLANAEARDKGELPLAKKGR